MSADAKTNERHSDTISTTPDGRTVVDAKRLFQKEHVKEVLRRVEQKIEIIRKNERPGRA
jgi:hypothetical protein